MTGTLRNRLLLLIAVLIGLLPLLLPQLAGQTFTGTDDQAREQILRLAPDYQPWLAPLLTPPGPETASLLFTLQAALGSAMLGYWLGAAVTRARAQKETQPTQPGETTGDHHAG